MQGIWLPLIEYVRVMDSSVSTVRRHIKKNKVSHRLENGKYLILCNEQKYQEYILNKEKSDLSVQLENIRLKNQVTELKEEIQELKMLMKVYEERLTPPELPELPL
jgi:hypothetical protein